MTTLKNSIPVGPQSNADSPDFYRKRFEALVAAHSAFVWTTGPSGLFVEEQPGWAAYTGQSFEEYKGDGGFECVHRDDHAKVREVWARAIERRGRYEVDMRLWHAATKTWRWCTLRSVPVLDDSGEVVEWVGSATDIDDIKRNEVVLRESERRFRSIMERVQAVGVMLDAEGRVTFVNDYFITLTGRTREEVIGKNYFELFIDPECFIKGHFKEAMASGDVFAHAENEILTKTGERRMVAWDNTILRDSDGRVVGTASIGRDITEMRKAELELRESEERLRLALKASKTGIWDIDLKTGLLTWSEECFVIHGITPAEFDGTAEAFWRCVHPVDVERLKKSFRDTVEHHKPYVEEFRIVRSDGQVRWVSNLAHLTLDEQQQPVRVVGTIIDITSKKETEEALRKAERFAAAGRMAATVAHEINNPLASLVNVLYLLGTQELSSAGRELLDIGTAELNRVVRISKQTLGFYQGSKMPSTIDVAAIVEDVRASIAHVAMKRGVKLKTTLKGSIPTLHGFGDEIRQVLINALTNALESSASAIEIRVRPARSWRGTGRTGVKIMVLDNGKGIDQRNRQSLFEPFFTTKGEKGTGLGLWVSRGIVLKHEGEISLRSSTVEGRSGTCVSIFLPTGTTRAVAVAGEAKG